MGTVIAFAISPVLNVLVTIGTWEFCCWLVRRARSKRAAAGEDGSN